MGIEKHIWKLLQVHDEVVLPGFGILSAHYSAATIHPTQHLFQPPCKSLAFDKNENITGDMLVKFISEEENISIDKAGERVQRFLTDAESRLNMAGSYFMEGIGKFYFDIEKQIQFLTDNTNNFLLTSYGLSDFVSQPVLRPENIPGYAVKQPQSEKKKRRFIWFRF